MFLTRDQMRILAVLEKTGWLKLRQILRLLRLDQPQKTMDQVQAATNQLTHISKAVLSGNLLCLPRRRMETPDDGMIMAVDIMLDLSCGKFFDLETDRLPYKLRFSVDSEGDRQPMGVIYVPAGHEAGINAALSALKPDRTVILALEDNSQMGALYAPAHSYFTVRDSDTGRMRYYRGGDA